MKLLYQKAVDHYHRANLKYRCLRPLIKLVEMSRQNGVVAQRHYNLAVKRYVSNICFDI